MHIVGADNMGLDLSTQIIIGALPALLFLLVMLAIAIGKKKNLAAYVISVALFSLLVAGAAVFLPDFSGRDTPQTSQPVEAVRLSAEDSIELAYALADAGDIALAEKFLAEAVGNTEYTDSFTLAWARLANLSGDEKTASVLYGKLGEAPGEGPATVRISASYQSIAHAVVYAESAYDAYLADGSLDIAEIRDTIDAISREERKSAGAFTSWIVREARLKLFCLSGDYSGIAATISSSSNYKELIIASELIISGNVRTRDFSADFMSKQEVEAYSAAADKLRENYEAFWGDAKREERNRIRNVIKSFEAIKRDPVIRKIENYLLDHVGSPGAEETSKTFMQLAKIEIYLGNESQSDAYIDRAMAEIAGSNDEAYRAPMYELIGIINDKNDAERLKDVAYYVHEVLENALPVKLADASEFNALSSGEGFSAAFLAASDTDADALAFLAASGSDAEADDDDASINDKIEQSINNAVVKKRTSVKIVDIDASNFTEIAAVVTLDGDVTGTDDEIKDMLSVYDCGIKIDDFTIEKVNYSGANILLVCDTSGSMGDYGKINDLKEAVKSFVDTKNADENIGLVTFSDSVGESYAIGTDAGTLISVADSLRAVGGTAIYETLRSAAVLDKFDLRPDELNFIILMSDGQDNIPAGGQDINDNVAIPANAKGVVIYSLGLGRDVDANYLAMFSDFTGGGYQYAGSSEQIQALFSSLRALAQNRYILRYTAKDILTVNPRELKVSITTQSFASDTAYYTLDGSEPNIPSPGGQTNIILDGKAIYGFTPSYVVKSGKDYKVELKGEGFDENDNIRLFLRSAEENTAVDAELSLKYVDEFTYDVTVPYRLPIGFYNLVFRIDGKEGVLQKAFYIASAAGDEKYAFGPYVFTAKRISKDPDGTVVLSDFVTLGGWLHFSGDVAIRKQDDTTAYFTDYGGSYIRYDKATADGALSNYLADKGVSVPITPFYEMVIYNDTQHNPKQDDYRTEEHAILCIGLGLIDVSPKIRLYPDRLKIEVPTASNEPSIMLNLPLAEKIIKSDIKSDIKTRQKGWNNFFVFSVTLGGTLDGTKAGVNIDFKFDRMSRDYTVLRPVTLGKQNIALNPSADIKIDTYKGDYDIKFMMDFSFMKTERSRKTDDDGFGLRVAWKSNKFDTLLIFIDVDVKTVIGGVPATISKFNGGVTGISENPENPLKWSITAGCNIAFAKANTIIPGLPAPFGNEAVFTFSEAKLLINLGKIYVEISSNLKVVGLSCGDVKVQAGKISYSNEILGMYKEEAWGITAALNVGIDFKAVNVSIDVGGGAELALTSRWCGITVKGHLVASIDLWIVHPSINVGGKLVVGVEITRSGQLQFILAGRADGKTKNAFYLSWCGGQGGGY